MSEPSGWSFGGKKYAAFNLMLAKWLRSTGDPTRSYRYVTLGGSELYDVANISWVNRQLARSILSYEEDRDMFRLANEKAEHFRRKGIDINIIKDDVFSYRRSMDGPHIYYLDFLRICRRAAYQLHFQTWFEKDVIQPGDLLFITSNLTRRQGWQKMLEPFKGDFAYLKIDDKEKMKFLYDIVHPLFVLARALIDSGLGNELSLLPLGCIKYRDKRTLMGLYGFTCEDRRRDLTLMVQSVPFFDYETRDWGNLN